MIRATTLRITNTTGENPITLVSALFLTLSGLVLLLAGGNVMNLLFVRVAARHREMAVLSALAAAGTRLIRQAITETGLMVALGCAAGLATGVAAARALSASRLRIDGIVASTDWPLWGGLLFNGAAHMRNWHASRVGAQPGQVILALFRQVLVMVSSGIVAGIVCATLMTKLVGTFLVDVSAFDPLTYAAV
jgi:hypothetical protein